MSKNSLIIDKDFNFGVKSKKNFVDLNLNSQLRTKLKIDLWELHRQIIDQNNTESITLEIEECIDALITKVFETISVKLEDENLKKQLRRFNLSEIKYDIIQKLDGILENQSMQEIDNQATIALEYFRNIQKSGFSLEEFRPLASPRASYSVVSSSWPRARIPIR